MAGFRVRRGARRLGLLAAAGGAPAPAFAHTPFEGFEGLYKGLAHPALEPMQGLALVAAGLVMGRAAADGGAGVFARAWLVFAAAALAGLGAHLALGAAAMTVSPAAAAALLVGGAVALTAQLARPMVLAASAVSGLAAGWTALPDPGPAAAVAVTALGAMLAALLLPGFVAARTSGVMRRSVRHPVLAIVLRVLASWIAAIAVLVIAFSLRPAMG